MQLERVRASLAGADAHRAMSTSMVKILPSPIFSVRAASRIASSTASAIESSTTTSILTFGHEVDGVLRAAVDLGVALLATVAANVA